MLSLNEFPQQAIILAGGLGTRLRAVAPDRPKPMALVGGRQEQDRRQVYERSRLNGREPLTLREFCSIKYYNKSQKTEVSIYGNHNVVRA
jgi:hypothetical protein